MPHLGVFGLPIWGLIDTFANCQHSGLGPVFDLELAEQSFQLPFHGFARHVSEATNLFIVETLCNKMEYLELEIRQPVFVKKSPFSLLPGRIIEPPSLIQCKVSKIGRGVALAGVGVAYDLDKVRSIGVF